METIDSKIMKELILSKYQYKEAEKNIQSNNYLKMAFGINLLHDCLDMFQIAIIDHLKLRSKKDDSLIGRCKKIEEELSQNKIEIESYNFIADLNTIRNKFKHSGIFPAEIDCNHYLGMTYEYINTACEKIFYKKYLEIFLSGILADGKPKEYIKIAEKDFEKGNYKSCLINCRKSIYKIFEYQFDIRKESFLSKVFGTPADEIPAGISDYSQLTNLSLHEIDLELLKYGLNTKYYWNIHRLTPKVVYANDKIGWIVREDFRVLNDPDIRQNCEYVLNAAIDIIDAIQNKIRSTKDTKNSILKIKLKKDNVPIYYSANKNTAEICKSKSKNVIVDFKIQGTDKNNYWHVIGIFKMGKHQPGYIKGSDVEASSAEMIDEQEAGKYFENH
ncbi:hypothetical protein K8S19_03845 [bacterium]|nr:hypothetical protein [bacterium]